MSAVQVMYFYSLWNQAVSRLIRRYAPDIYYCVEACSCMAPWYVWGDMERNPRMLLHLHDADDIGSIGADEMSGWLKRQRLSRIFGLMLDYDTNLWYSSLVHMILKEGQFCMLRMGLKYVKYYQKGGFGLVRPSHGYCMEVSKMRPLYWWWKGRTDYFNTPILDSDRSHTEDLTTNLKSAKRAAKAQTQAHLGLETDLNAPLFIVIACLTKNRGSDMVADVALWLLQTYHNAQLIVLGPIQCR